MINCFGGGPTAKIIHSKPGPLQVCLKNINAKLPYGHLASRITIRIARYEIRTATGENLLTSCDSAVYSVVKINLLNSSGCQISKWFNAIAGRYYFAAFSLVHAKKIFGDL